MTENGRRLERVARRLSTHQSTRVLIGAALRGLGPCMERISKRDLKNASLAMSVSRSGWRLDEWND
jgi:hypothetical protein